MILKAQFTTKYLKHSANRYLQEIWQTRKAFFKENNEFEVCESLTGDQIDRNISWPCGEKPFSCLVKFQRFYFSSAGNESNSNVLYQLLIVDLDDDDAEAKMRRVILLRRGADYLVPSLTHMLLPFQNTKDKIQKTYRNGWFIGQHSCLISTSVS